VSNTAIVKEGFGEKSIEKRGETAASALISQARAEVEARYVMALQRPRDADVVRAKLLHECKRPNFARRAFFQIPRGDKPGRLTGTPNTIEGLSVRFAEAAIRLSGNIHMPTRTLYDDEFKRIINVAATDLETNATYARDVSIEKTIERSKVKEGAIVLGKRTNSAGKEVFILQATDEELLQKEGAMISKTFRTLALRLIPADTLEECEQALVLTVRDENAKDPDGVRKRILDAYIELGVSPAELKVYVGHDLDQLNSDERMSLGALAAAIREGEVTWAEAFAEKTAPKPEPGAAPSTDPAAKKVASRIGERVAKAKERRAAETQASAQPKPEGEPKRPTGREPGEEG
jgi:hypothetical protein